MQISNLGVREEGFVKAQKVKAQKQAQKKAEQEQKAKEGVDNAEAVPLITEEEAPAITNPRMLYAIIIEDIKKWQKREEAPEFYEYFEDFARKEKEEYLSKKEGYDQAGYQAFNLDLTAPSRKEKARRKANYNRASQIARRLIAFNAVAPTLCNDLMSYDEVKKVKDENGQEHDVIEKIGLSRKVQHTIIPLSNDFDEMEKQMKAFKEASSEEKTKIFVERLQLLKLFVTNIYSATSDEALLNLIDGHEPYFHALAEFDEYDRPYYKEELAKMGLDVDKLYKEHEQDLAFLKEFGQSANIYQERIGMMTSPCYLRYKNLSQFNNAYGKIEQDSFFRRHPEVPGFMSEFSLQLYPQSAEDKKEKFFSPVSQFLVGLNTCTSQGALAGSYEMNKPGAIADTLKMMAYQSGIKDLKLKDKNKELNMLDACFALYNKKYLDVYDGTSFVKRICVENDFGNFKTNVYQDKIYNPLNDVEEFKETIKSLKAEAKEANPWYMRLRNLRNPGDFSQLASELDKLKEVNTQDLAKSAQIFKDLAEKADTYLQRKLNDVDTHTELTEKRIALALKVYNICKHGEEKALMLENNNPLNEEKKALDLDMPNEVVANNLTQVKEEAKQVEKKSEIIEDINKI